MECSLQQAMEISLSSLAYSRVGQASDPTGIPGTFSEFSEALRQRGANIRFLHCLDMFAGEAHVTFKHAMGIVIDNMCSDIDEYSQYNPTVHTLQQAGLTFEAAQSLWNQVLSLPSLYSTRVGVWVFDYLAAVFYPLSDQPPYPFEACRGPGPTFPRLVSIGGCNLNIGLKWMDYDEASRLGYDADVNLIDLFQLSDEDPDFVYLYHGTNTNNITSIIRHGVRLQSGLYQDFNFDGGGYYVTSDRGQAWKWAWKKAGDRSGMAIVVHRVARDRLYANTNNYVLFDTARHPRESRLVQCLHSYDSIRRLNDWAKLMRHCRSEEYVDGLCDVDFIEGPYLSNAGVLEYCKAHLDTPCKHCDPVAVGHQLCVLKRGLANAFTPSIVGVFISVR